MNTLQRILGSYCFFVGANPTSNYFFFFRIHFFKSETSYIKNKLETNNISLDLKKFVKKN